jgi:hypothetical protein
MANENGDILNVNEEVNQKISGVNENIGLGKGFFLVDIFAIRPLNSFY